MEAAINVRARTGARRDTNLSRLIAVASLDLSTYFAPGSSVLGQLGVKYRGDDFDGHVRYCSKGDEKEIDRLYAVTGVFFGQSV